MSATVAVAGVDSGYLRVLATVLSLRGLDVRLVVERPPERRRRPLGPWARFAEGLYSRLLGRLRARKSREHDVYWRCRLPETLPCAVHEVKSLNGRAGRRTIEAIRPELMLTYGPRRLRRRTYDKPRLGTFNLHGGYLPEYRGTLSEFWAIRNGELGKVGVSLHRMTEELDGGDVCFFLPVPARQGDDELDARLRWQRKLLWTIADWVRGLLEGGVSPVAQEVKRARTWRTPGWADRLVVDLRRLVQWATHRQVSATEEICLPPGKRMAIAVGSDIDETTVERLGSNLRTIRERAGLRGYRESMFFYQTNAGAAGRGQVSLFDGVQAGAPHPTAYEAVRAELAKGGIETNHGWGDFSAVGGFTRTLAREACEWLEARGLRLPIWVNHGDPCNVQNVGPLADYGRGDDPAAASVYHLDLARRAGARYFWIGHLTPHACLGGHGLSVREALLRTSLDRPASHRVTAFVLALAHRLTRLSLFLRAVHRLGWSYLPDARLVFPQRFRDGTWGWVYRRSGRWERDDWRAFDELLQDKNLQRARRDGGAILVYTHLGKGEPSDAAIRRLALLSCQDDVWTPSVCGLLDAALSFVHADAPLFRGAPPPGQASR